MNETLLHRLFGLGKLPRKYAPALQGEGIVLIDEGIGGSVTYKHFRAPGRRYGWKKSWFTGCLVLTGQTFAAFAWTRPLIRVPLEDKRLSELQCSVQDGGTLLIVFEASLFSDKRTGKVKVRFRTAKAKQFLEQLGQKTA